MIRGWLITAEGHTTAREKGIAALEWRQSGKKSEGTTANGKGTMAIAVDAVV